MPKALKLTAVVLVLAILGLTPTLNAQNGRTGALSGIVTDDQGDALPGVTVTLTSPQLMGSRNTVTGRRGEYEFALLPPGIYRAEFVLTGLDPRTRQNIVIPLDSTHKVNVSLSAGSFAETRSGTVDSVVIDPTQTAVQQNFRQDHLKYAAVGQAGRTYQNVLQQAPGVAGGTNPQVMGANLRQNSFLLDGMNSTDPVTHTFGSNLIFDSIQEISILTLGKDAEYGKGVGGVVNVVTRSGGNEFEGSLDARYTSYEWSEQGRKRRPNSKALRFDKDTHDFRTFEPAGTLGGSIVRDRAWFFASAQLIDHAVQLPFTDGAATGERRYRGWNSMGRVTSAPVGNQTLAFRYIDADRQIETAQSAARTVLRPDANSWQRKASTIYNLSYDAVLTSRWLASAQVGRLTGTLTSEPMSDDPNPTGWVDRGPGIRPVNSTRFPSSDRDRDEFLPSTTFYFEGAGTHALKAGTALEWTSFTSKNFTTGTPQDTKMCSDPVVQPAGARCSTVTPAETYEGQARAFYIQDEWRPFPHLTARAGLRYEMIDFTTPGAAAPSFELLQPRLGIAYDLFNNSNTVIYGFAGRVMDDNALTLPSFLSTHTFDRTLKPTYSDELTIGFRQEILTNTVLDITSVMRESHDIFEDTCVDKDCEAFELTNEPFGSEKQALRAEYEAAILKIESRPYRWLSALFSYTWSESKGSVEYTQNAGTDFDVCPDHCVNRFGFLSDDATHRVKASGFVKVPWDVTLGVNYQWDTGASYNVTASNPPSAGYGTYFVEARGSRRLPHFNQLDFQFQKDFNFRGLGIGLIGSIHNLMGTEIPRTVGASIGPYGVCRQGIDIRCTRAGTGLNGESLRITSPTFGVSTTWQRPRSYEVGLRFEF